MGLAFLGRQPIVNTAGETLYYSLLFRQNNSKRTMNLKEEMVNFATSISDLLYSLGTKEVLEGKCGFLKVDDQTIIKTDLSQLPKNAIIFELTEQTNFSIKVSQEIEALVSQGYRFALPHTLLDEVIAKRDQSFLALFDYVMFNLRKFDLEILRKHESLMQELGMTKIATKVETLKGFEMARSLGFELFLGFFFEEPKVIKGKRLASDKTKLMQLMSQLQSDAPIEEIIQTIKYSPEISLKLLKFINNANSTTSKEIESIERAVTLLGREKLKSWVSLLLFTAHDQIPHQTLIDTALMRGRLMELMCDATKRPHYKASAYLVGIMSLSDAIFKIPLEKIIEEALFSDVVSEALLKQEGELGKILKLVQVIEHGDFRKIEFIAAKLKISLEQFTAMYKDAYRYVNKMKQV